MIHDALVVGGGPAGATAALLLARAGWSVAVVEKKAFPRRKVCGEFISASSGPLLQELGIADRFLAAAGPLIRRVGIFAGDIVRAAPMPAAEARDGSWGRALGRETLDTLLLDAARRAGAEIVQPFAAKSLRRDGQNYFCMATSKDMTPQIAARIVIAAHGSWESNLLPAQNAPRRNSDLLAFKAHFSGARLPRDLMPLLIFPGGYGGIVHTDNGRVSLSCCIRRDVLRRCRRGAGGAAQAVFDHIRASCRGVEDALADATRDGAWLSAGPIRPGIRARYKENIFFIGNAAGEAHPIIAEGISMAMQSAWLLCRRLLAPNIPAGQAAKEYAADWHAAFAPRIYAAALFAQVAQRPQLAGAATSLISRFPILLTFGARLSGKTTMVAARKRYRFSSEI